MIGVTILDRTSTGALAPTLLDLLLLLRTWARELSWSASGVEATGLGAEPLHELEASGAGISFEALLTLAEGVDQVIDGEFYGLSRTGTVEMTIRAVDSSAFDVETSEPKAAELVEASFKLTRRFSVT